MRRLSSSNWRGRGHLGVVVCLGLFSVSCADPSSPTAPAEQMAGDVEDSPDILAHDSAGSPDAVGDAGGVDAAPVAPPPFRGLQIQSLEPDHGPVEGGAQVVLIGTGFREGIEVLFGDLPVLDTFVLNQGAAMVTIPPHPPGIVDVHLRHPDIDKGEPFIFENAFMYEADLIVAVVAPEEGDVTGGEPITVQGAGFTPDAMFYVGGRPGLEQRFVDSHTLEGLTPPGETGVASVHVVTPFGVGVAEDIFLYREAPSVQSLEPVAGPSAGGTSVTLHGGGLSTDAEVWFGDAHAVVSSASSDGARLEVESPAGPAGSVVDVTVVTPSGTAIAPHAWAWQDPSVDPYVLSCSHLFPNQGSVLGGGAVQVACWGLHYGAEVSFGGVEALVTEVAPDAGLLFVEVPPGLEGSVDVQVEHAYGAALLEDAYTYLPEPLLRVDEVTPNTGAIEGGALVAVHGAGFTEDAAVRFGAMWSTSVDFVSPTELTVVVPPGSAGAVAVTVAAGDTLATLVGGYTYSNGGPALHLIEPHEVAIAGGTLWRVLGEGFDESTTLSVDGQECQVLGHEGTTVLWARSPPLSVGTHSAAVTTAAGTVSRENAVNAFDPRTGYSGTWGGTIQGHVNVTVHGVQGFGPIAGAFVYVARGDGQAISGHTNENGQVTLSEPWLEGPLDVTASAVGWTAYTIAQADARNVTVYLRTTAPSTGPPEPIQYPPDAILIGQVIGLDKYVVPPAGPCPTVANAAGTPDCQLCASANDCGDDSYSCVELLEQGDRCLRACQSQQDCPAGYVCAGFEDHLSRCMPSPGEKIAKCGVSATSIFSQAIYPPETGWVHEGETFELPSTRLGELAIVCYGGYRATNGAFTPTALGVRRHVYGTAGALMDGLDVTLSHPLDRTFRFRLLDQPTWPEGTREPAITLSVDLGPDGAIPLTRPAFGGWDEQWRVARQLGELTGDLYDGTYSVYTRVTANTPESSPTGYALKRKVSSIVQARLPYHDGDGWHLDGTGLEDDLHSIWASPDGRFTAVGAGGVLLFHNGQSWYEQTSGTSETLHAVHGTSWDDQWAAGAHGTVLRWTGLSWAGVDAPVDTYRAVATANGQPVWFAGEVRLRRRDADGSWHVDGPPWLQRVRALDVTEAGHVVGVGEAGRAFLRTPSGTWSTLATDVQADLLGVSVDSASGEIVAVGAGGVVLVGSVSQGTMAAVELDTTLDLTAVGRAGATLYVAGDAGLTARRVDGVWTLETVEGYDSRAHGIAVSEESGVTRIVGSVSFVIGPFMGYPVLQGTVLDADTGAVTLNWSYLGGAPAHYTRLNVSSEKYGPTVWTLIVGRGQTSVVLPDLTILGGLAGLGSGSRAVEIQRVLNRTFDIDDYMSRQFNIYHRAAWSSERTEFYAP